MIEYRIETSGDEKYLASTIGQAGRNGWTLQGGVAVTRIGDGDFIFAQAMIRTINQDGAV
jgi:hypothetical protein